MTLPRRLLVLLVLIAVLMSAAGLFSYVGLKSAMVRSRQLSFQTLRAREASLLRTVVWDIRGLAANALINSSELWETLAKERIEEADVLIDRLKLDAGLRKTWERFSVRIQVVFSRKTKNPEQGRSLLFGPVFKDLKILDDALGQIVSRSSLSAGETVDNLETTQTYVIYVYSTWGLIGLALLGWAYQGARIVARDLRNLEEDVAALGTGRKRPEFVTRSKGEIQSMAHALSRMAEALGRKSKMLRDIARTDPLTKLPNRRAFNEALAKAWSKSQKISLILFDIDHFKIYNDTHGHTSGDEVLKCLGKELPGLCPAKSQVARWGGEEFAVLLPGLARERACKVAETIRRGIEGLHKKYPSKLPEATTISLGVATTVSSQGPAKILVEFADRTLYQAKRKGRNRWEVGPE